MKRARFTAAPWVRIELRAPYVDGGGLVSRFLEWCIRERVRLGPMGGCGGDFCNELVHPEDAQKCIDWLRAQGAEGGR